MWPFNRQKEDTAPEQRSVDFQDVWGKGQDFFSPAGQEKALRLIPVYACTRLIADGVASLPLQGYRENKQGDKTAIPLPSLFQSPGTRGTLYEWLFKCMTSLLLRGNAYGLVMATDKNGWPTQIEWLSPDQVDISNNLWLPGQDPPVWYFYGRELKREELIHVPGYVLPGQIKGVSPIKAYAQTIDIGLNAMSFGADWFENGSIPAALLVAPEDVEVDDDDANVVKQRFKTAAANRDLAVISGGFRYEQVSVPPEESQFLQTLKMTATQIASIYGVPPEMIGGETGSSMTYKTQEQQSINFLTYTLRPWIARLEAAFAEVLPRPQNVRFNADAVIRTDALTRHEVYQIDRAIGIRSVNEIRRDEGLAPIPGGDQFGPVAPVGPTGGDPNAKSAGA